VTQDLEATADALSKNAIKKALKQAAKAAL
jgi:hypothetical protein